MVTSEDLRPVGREKEIVDSDSVVVSDVADVSEQGSQEPQLSRSVMVTVVVAQSAAHVVTVIVEG